MRQIATTYRKNISEYCTSFVKSDTMLERIGISFCQIPFKSHS